MDFLCPTALALMLGSAAALMHGRLQLYQVYGCFAVAFTLLSIDATRHHLLVWASLAAVWAAAYAWAWWTFGGGDDTKKRLRRLRRAFRGVRRTAPATA